MTRSKVLIALGYVAPLVVLACVLQLSRVKNVPLHKFLRDPLAVTHSPFYTGAVSNLGIICWSAAVGIALFVSSMRKTNPAARRFFVGFGILTLLLVMDDLYQIHEEVFPKYVGPEQSLVLCYGIFTALLLLRYRRFILSREYGHLIVAFAFFAMSVAIDVLDPPGTLALLMEDGAKLVGIVAWTTFTAVAGIAELNARPAIATDVELVEPVGRAASSRHNHSEVKEANVPIEAFGV